jgi:hypothetical protein
MTKLLNIFELSKEKGRPVRQIRSFVQHRKIPYLKIGHRTLLFDPQRVEEALQRFEIKEVGAAPPKREGRRKMNA